MAEVTNKQPSAKEIRAARAFLRRRGIGTKTIPPKKFAAAAKEQNLTFTELFKSIARIMMTGRSQSEKRKEIIAQELEKSGL